MTKERRSRKTFGNTSVKQVKRLNKLREVRELLKSHKRIIIQRHVVITMSARLNAPLISSDDDEAFVGEVSAAESVSAMSGGQKEEPAGGVAL